MQHQKHVVLVYNLYTKSPQNTTIFIEDRVKKIKHKDILCQITKIKEHGEEIEIKENEFISLQQL